MMPPDRMLTRTYYWTWQALAVAMTVLVGAVTYWILRPFHGTPAESDTGTYLFIGIIVGVVMTNAWNRLKYGAVVDRPDKWHPDRRKP
jgi:hypothetical protein